VPALRIGIALIVVGLAVFAVSPHTGGLLVAVIGGMISGIGGGIVQPNTMATVQRIAPDHARGGVTSAFLSASYLAMSLPVVVAGLGASAAGVDLGTISWWYLALLAVVATAAISASRPSTPRERPAGRQGDRREHFLGTRYAPR
jgi:MFS family permease